MEDNKDRSEFKILLEEKEIIFIWNQSTTFEYLEESLIQVMNDIKKTHDTAQIELQTMQGIKIEFQDIFEGLFDHSQVFLPARKLTIAAIMPEIREVWDEYDLTDPETIRVTKNKKKNLKEKVTYSLSVLKKMNQNFKETFQEFLESNDKMRNLQVTKPQVLLNNQPMPVPKFTENEGSSSPKFGVAHDDVDFDVQKRKKIGGGDGISQGSFNKLAQSKKPAQLRGITPEEIQYHNKPTDCWTVYHGKVYDITDYLKFHPGGVAKLMLGAGKDCSALVTKYHHWVNVHYMLQNFQVGYLSL